jgi:hypothetical protein
MTRTYRTVVERYRLQRAGPFHVTAELSWRWDALQTARTAAREEDVLMELLGRDGYDLVTKRPWLRVDVILRASLPLDSPLPMSGAEAWRRWIAETTARLALLLPTEAEAAGSGMIVHSWGGQAVARLRCEPDGRLLLTGVEWPAWQMINLVRQWDDSEREPDESTDEELADFVDRVREALQVWESCLQYLGPAAD